jgi:hypothetical protein
MLIRIKNYRKKFRILLEMLARVRAKSKGGRTQKD